MLENARFRAAYDFLLLREQAGENLQNLGQWWTDYQAADTEQRQQMQQSLSRAEGPARKNNRRRGGRNRSGAKSDSAKAGQD